jgi:pilus assembly protein CpaE
MLDVPRLILADPNEDSRANLRTMIPSAVPVSSYDEVRGIVDAQSVDVVFVVMDSSPRRSLALIQDLARKPDLAVIAATTSRDAERMLQAYYAGAREFILLPCVRSDLDQILGRLSKSAGARAAGPALEGRVIALVGAAGGVGCTSLALNLAVAIQREDPAPVALADLDLITGQIAAWLEIEPETSLLELTQAVTRLDPMLLRRAMIRHEGTGLNILPGLHRISDSEHLDPEALARLLALVKSCHKALVLDLSKGLQTTDFVGLSLADDILMVVELEMLGLHSALRLMSLFREHEELASKVRLVLNRAGSKASEMRIRKVEETLGLEFSFQVPNAFRAFHQARSAGLPLPPESGGTGPMQALTMMARQLVPPSDEALIEPSRRRSWWPSRGRVRAIPAV